MEKKYKLVIVGAGEFAEIAYEYFTADSEYEVVAFAVEKQYITETRLFNLSVVEFERIVEIYPPSEYKTFVALYYGQLNRSRTRLFRKCKELGYTCASFVSPYSFVWHNVSIGENCFIFEDNTLQYHVQIGDNVILWSGNHIGHRAVIEDNCWITSHVVISYATRIGENSFIGVNATLGDEIVVGQDTVLSAGSVTIKDITEKGGVYVGNPVRKLNRTAYEQFNVQEKDL